MQALHSERLIDVPIESLPFVDEHSTTVDASPDATWEALLETDAPPRPRGRRLRSPGRSAARTPSAAGQPGRIGSTIPGFIVTRSVAPCVLALMGEHRFSRVRARLPRSPRPAADRVQLGAETRAEFPGAAGRVYRIAVIGSRGHVRRDALDPARRPAARRRLAAASESAPVAARFCRSTRRRNASR